MCGLFMRWLCLAFVIPWVVQAADAPGLAVTFKSVENVRDVSTSPNFALYVEAGKAPSPFIPEGKFLAIWEGNIVVDLRSEFSFAAELNGTLKLEINDAVVLEGTGPHIPLSKAIQLKKGANPLRAVFTSPAQGDAFLRVGWTEKGTNTAPIPPAVLTHTETDETKKGAQLRRGRELFVEHRCIKCHGDARRAPELAMDAPAFDGIGAR